MNQYCVLLSIPGLRSQDLDSMPRLRGLAADGGSVRPLSPSFPAVTCPVQVNLTSGVGPETHGVVANGFYWREKGQVEMWTAWNESVRAPQAWDVLHQADESITSAVWFPLLSKGCGGDYICTFAPIHNPDGSESLWCYTRPTELYGDLRDEFGHFPLKHFWGPLANIKSTDWIVDSAIVAARRFAPRFSYIYLPHLDYAAQKHGPDSDEALAALGELDSAIGRLIDGYRDAGVEDCLWLAAGEYIIEAVDAVAYPNRVLRDAGLLSIAETAEGELLQPRESTAFAMCDHQFAHVYVNDSEQIDRVADLFREQSDVEAVYTGLHRGEVGLDCDRSGEVIVVSPPDRWFAYYWWENDANAPSFARTIDIHKKPGYDPVEMFFDPATKGTPLDATLVKGSHGYPADAESRHSVLIASDDSAFYADALRDVDVANVVLRNFGVTV